MKYAGMSGIETVAALKKARCRALGADLDAFLRFCQKIIPNHSDPEFFHQAMCVAWGQIGRSGGFD